MTIAHRVEPKMYVSLWYISGSLIWMPLLYFIGNVMWNPPTGALTGINDTIFNWFYGHNVLGLWFTTGLLPVIYYVVPKETRTPLYSHFLSLIAFWGIIFFYTGVGSHHLLWAPIPYWLKTVSVAESIGMVLPVVAFMMNIFLTMRGNWNRLVTSIPLRFVVTGWAAYILVSYQGSHQALRAVGTALPPVRRRAVCCP
jgi:cbb3-type cytochrome oxidase subunit 1